MEKERGSETLILVTKGLQETLQPPQYKVSQDLLVFDDCPRAAKMDGA